jgi:hypothetical protein
MQILDLGKEGCWMRLLCALSLASKGLLYMVITMSKQQYDHIDQVLPL